MKPLPFGQERWRGLLGRYFAKEFLLNLEDARGGAAGRVNYLQADVFKAPDSTVAIFLCYWYYEIFYTYFWQYLSKTKPQGRNKGNTVIL